MHLYTLFMCAKNGIDAIYIFSLAAIFVFFLRSDISNLILFRHFANEHCSMYCLSFMILPNELRSLWTYFWLIWHSCQWAYRIMICPSSSVQSHPEQTINHRDFIFYAHMHLCPISKPSKNYVAVTIILKLAAIFVFLVVCADFTLSTLLIIETSYFMHICTYVPSQSLAKIMLLWPLFSNWQPYLCFSLNLSPGHTVDDTDFIFGRLMHLYTLFMCAKNGIDAIYIFSLAAIFVFFLRSDISNLILFRHFANEHCSMYCLSFMILPNELRSLWTYFGTHANEPIESWFVRRPSSSSSSSVQSHPER